MIYRLHPLRIVIAHQNIHFWQLEVHKFTLPGRLLRYLQYYIYETSMMSSIFWVEILNIFAPVINFATQLLSLMGQWVAASKGTGASFGANFHPRTSIEVHSEKLSMDRLEWPPLWKWMVDSQDTLMRAASWILLAKYSPGSWGTDRFSYKLHYWPTKSLSMGTSKCAPMARIFLLIPRTS